MSNEFITTTGRLSIKNGKVWNKRIIDPERNYWFFFLLLGISGISYFVYEIIVEKKYQSIIRLIFWVTVLWAVFSKFFNFLFTDVWRSYIPLHEIKSVLHDKEFNDLEERVIIRLKNTRQKIYLFRGSEHQAAPFVQTISEMVPEAVATA